MDPLTVRAFQRDTDTIPLLQLLQEAEAFDRTGETWSGEKLALYLNAPGHNPERERWVIEDPAQPGTLLGQSTVYLPSADDERRVADGMVLVHPTQRRLGLGRMLMKSLEQYLSQNCGIKTLRFYLDAKPDAKNKEAKTFAQHYGLTAHPADSYRRMVAKLAEVTLESRLPEGFRLFSHREVNSLPTVVEALNLSYAGLYGHRSTSEVAFAPILESCDPDGFFILFDADGRVAGTVSAEAAPDLGERTGVLTGRIGNPGVVPGYRSPDLYGALLVAGSSYLRARGMVRAELETWGDHATTVAAYQALGFTLDATTLAYIKDL